MKLLLIEDDLPLGKAVAQALRQAGFDVCWVRLLRDAEAQLAHTPFAAVLLDLGLPDGGGMDILQRLRDRDDPTPILILTARDAVEDRVRGLDAGADDYLPKPFAMPELISRLRALTRRGAGFRSQIWKVDGLALDPINRRASLDGEALPLSPKEFDILLELMRNVGQVVRKPALEQLLSGAFAGVESNALEVHVHNLRRKLSADRIVTVRGVGYLLRKNGP